MNKLSMLKIVLKDKNRKPIFTIVKELTHCFLLEKEIPYYYFSSFLYKKQIGNYRDYIGHKRVSLITNEYFYKGDRHILKDKIEFGKVLEENNIQGPKTLAYNVGKTLYIDYLPFEINTVEKLTEVINNLINKTKNKSIFVKPLEGMNGKDTFKFTGHQKLNNRNILKLFNIFKLNNFILQETIIQHKNVNKIYDKSINAVRVHSFYDRRIDKVEIISTLMRFGANDSIVDNGNLFIEMDSRNWKLKGVARSLFKNGGEIFKQHPNTHVKLDGFQIPHGHLIEKEIDKAARVFDKDFIGWDVAITEDGVLIIEGNDSPHLIMAQVGCGGLRNHKGFEKVFSEFL